MDEMNGTTMDIVTDNIAKLRELFPEAFTEGKVDFDALKEVLGEYVENKEERYRFTWNGKSKARMLAQTPSTGTLRPCPEESVDWDNSKNIFIEGDNLEVLKLLQKSYHKKVKMIYIDPPYNTGKDFVYKDNFKDNIKNYKEITGQVDGEGMNLSSNPETSGRYHTDWLNMMYPRLKIARNLLKENGFFSVSIDDAEVSNLTRILDEIFGEENRIAVTIWDRNRKNDAKFFSVGHEYILIYAKNKQLLKDQSVVLREPKQGLEEAKNRFENLRKKYKDNWDQIQDKWRDYYRSLNDSNPEKKIGRFTRIGSRGPFRDDGDISWPGGGGPRYDVKHPITGEKCKVPKGGWVYSTSEKFEQEVQQGRVVFGPDHTTLPRQCRYLFESNGQVMPSVYYSYAQTATMEFVQLMGNRVFENPKNWKDLKRIIRYLTTEPGDIVLDFFAGSCSSAHGVLSLISEEEMKRNFIMVQLPELCNEKSVAYQYGYKKISEISKDRIRKVIKNIKNGRTDCNGDLGFKVFKLDSTNIKPWDADFDSLDESLLNQMVDNIKDDRTEEDVLYEILIKYGLDLTLPITEHTLAGQKVFNIGMGALIICLSDTITLDVVEGIAGLKDEFKPEIMRVVFKDSGFKDDVVKTNAVQILKQAGIEDIRSL